MPAVACRFASLAVADERLHALERLLDADERARADRFRFAEDRRRFVARRGQLRELLAERTGVAPEAIRYVLGPHGKPALEDGAVEFNLSASGDWMLVAFGRAAVGCDIERVDAAFEWRGVAAAQFSSGEAAAARDASGFFRIWTRKEAAVKAAGCGLLTDPSGFSTLNGTARVAGTAILVANLVSPDGTAAAVAALDDGTPLAAETVWPQAALRQAPRPARLAS